MQRNELRSESNSRILEVAREVLLISNHVHIDAPSPHTKLYGGSAVSTLGVTRRYMILDGSI